MTFPLGAISQLTQGGPPSIRVQSPGPSSGASGGSGGGSEQKPVALLKQMIQLGHQYIQAEPDDVDKATMLKVLSTLQQYLAKDQQDAEKAMGVTPQARFMRKQNQG